MNRKVGCCTWTFGSATIDEVAERAARAGMGGERIGLYHAADSNREGVGEGHTDFGAQISALDEIGYAGPIILETNVAGPNPFTPDKGHGFKGKVEAQLKASAERLRAFGQRIGPDGSMTRAAGERRPINSPMWEETE